MTHLTLGEPAPWFIAPTHTNPRFNFSSVAGRYVVLGFLPDEVDATTPIQTQLRGQGAIFNDIKASCFLITRSQAVFDSGQDGNGVRWFFDVDDEIHKKYGLKSQDKSTRPCWIVLDPSLRVLAVAGLDKTAAVIGYVGSLPVVDDHAGVSLTAPVLVVPRIFEREFCKELIDYYNFRGGQISGVMREIDGKTVGVVDDFKKRRDAQIENDVLRSQIRARISRRLIPEIRKSFQFEAELIERYIVARYTAEEGGYFRAHRDNTTAGTAHRKFAVSINLNSEEFEGGELRFPEFGNQTYRPPTGGAVVFSCSLLHEAMPVTKGTRYAVLPFLYDQKSQKIREQNAHLIVVQEESSLA